MRTEKDFLGEVEIPADVLYGIHSYRAKRNFPDNTQFHIEWYRAIGYVKWAVYNTAINYLASVNEKYPEKQIPLKFPKISILKKLALVAEEASKGKYFEHFIVPAISGGAGTSINMNVNEIIANASLVKSDERPGDYSLIDPVEDANIFQSTNDVIPTSLTVALMFLLNNLEENINNTRKLLEELEKKHLHTLRSGYTQMQAAVPTSYGRLFSSYNEALSRDWWRVSKCFERLKPVNLGGSAIGSGITVPRFVILEVSKTLQQLTGLPVTKAENLTDATNNLDKYVEVHGILKAAAVNLEKMVSDFRLLSSDIIESREVNVPKQQAGSSIMPGKVNPVISEFVISSAHKIYANDQLIASLSAQGCLELNAYLPVIGHAALESVKLLIACYQTVTDNLLQGIIIQPDISKKKLYHNPSVCTALLPYIGYNKATDLAQKMTKNKMSIFEANNLLKIIDSSKLEELMQPESLLKLGYTMKEILT